LKLSWKLFADAGWTQRVLGQVAGVLLVVAAAGGLQKLCQETGMAELLGERLLAWHAGLLVPFLIAAVIKTLQGSSLVAAITAAGMMQSALLPLGLDNDSGKALATLAIGAGAMTFSHVNDEYFWLVTASTGLRPVRAAAALAGGTLLQGVLAATALLILSVWFSGN
jgi:GntP family gluconate:H+ symporter